jgi:hypothetical protein
MPKVLRKAQDQIKKDTNPLTNFLANGSGFVQVIHEEGVVTTLEQLNKAYSNWMEFDMKKPRQTIGSDYFPITHAGYTMKSVNICKLCGKKSSKKTCGAHYNSDNRTKRMCILNMRLFTKNDEANTFNGGESGTDSPVSF